MDIVYIRNLEIETTIGVFDWERPIRQIVSIDLEMRTDARLAAASESIADTLDYNAIANRVSEFVSASEYALVETLAQRIAELVMAEFGTTWIRLRVGKPGALPGATDVGVIIERKA